MFLLQPLSPRSRQGIEIARRLLIERNDNIQEINGRDQNLVERLVSYFYPVALNMSRNAPVTVRDLCRLCRLRTSWVIRTLCRETQLREDGPNELYEGIIRRRRQRPCSPFIRENENLLLTSAGICFLIQQHHGIRDIAIGLLVELVRRLVEIIIHLSHSHAEFRDRDATAHVEFRERRVERANTAINLLGEGSTRLRSQNSTMRDAYRSFVQVVDPEETSARNYLSTLQGRRVNGSVMNQLAPLGKSMMAILENQALEFITGRDARDEMIRIHNDNPTLTRERKQAMCRSKVENAYYRGIAARVGRCVREMLARPNLHVNSAKAKSNDGYHYGSHSHEEEEKGSSKPGKEHSTEAKSKDGSHSGSHSQEEEEEKGSSKPGQEY
eukprot:jgi/Bigna1/85351/estExt_fgenesh1_pg.C_30319